MVKGLTMVMCLVSGACASDAVADSGQDFSISRSLGSRCCIPQLVVNKKSGEVFSQDRLFG